MRSLLLPFAGLLLTGAALCVLWPLSPGLLGPALWVAALAGLLRLPAALSTLSLLTSVASHLLVSGGQVTWALLTALLISVGLWCVQRLWGALGAEA